MIYATTTFALAVLEVLAHAQIGKTPPALRSVCIDVPDDVSVEQLDPEGLPGWGRDDYAAAPWFAEQWIDEARTAVLLVPSVLSPVERNAVLNSRHSDFVRITSSPEEDLALDTRLQSPFGAGAGRDHGP